MNKTELKIEMMRNNDTTEDLAKALGIARPTLSKKMNDEKAYFNQEEMSIIRRRYNLSTERFMQIFFAEAVS